MSRAATLVTLVLAGLGAAGAANQRADWASPQPLEILAVRVGLAGAYKAGLWTPIEVLLQGGSDPFEGSVAVIVPDGDGVPSRLATDPRHPCRVGPGQRHWVRFVGRLGRQRGDLAVEVCVRDRVIARRIWQAGAHPIPTVFRPAVASSQPLLVCVAAGATGVEDAVRLVPREGHQRPAVVRLDNLGQLPTEWFAYEAVSTVVIMTSDPQTTGELGRASAQVAGLVKWVEMGGSVVLCVGRRAEELLGRSALLGALVPGRFEKMVPLRQTSALETYCQSPAPIRAADGGPPVLRVPQLTEVRGLIEAQEADLPLIVRHRVGFGSVCFVAADPDQPPLANWENRALLLCRLLGLPTAETHERPEHGALMHFGFTDLAGQLRSALDQFTEVGRVPFSVVLVFVAVYILLIGPADYFLLRRLLGRMTLTWITFPAIILVVGLGAWILAWGLKGGQVRAHQLDLIDVDVQGNLVRGTTWANVLSPRTQCYDVAFRPTAPTGRALERAQVLCTWFGLPGEALGGMNPRTAEPTPWRGAYDIAADHSRLARVPIPIWSTKSFTARWTAPAFLAVEADLHEQEDLPVGTITNRLPYPLEDGLLVYRNWTFELGLLRPGVQVQVGAGVSPKDLTTLLTGRRLVVDRPNAQDKIREEVAPYDRSSVDLAYILRIMTFYRAIDGLRYTQGLDHQYQPFVDSSHVLAHPCALLVACAPRDVSPEALVGTELHLCAEGQTAPSVATQRVVFYRFVIPVERQAVP